MSREYEIVDVFTRRALEGNPLAVFPDASGMDAAEMGRIARELNLSETAFVLPAAQQGCDARVRIFTPNYEMRFAGHPTVGTAFVLRERGIVRRDAQRMVLEEGIGPVAVRVELGDPPMFWLMTPPIETLGSRDRSACAQALGLQVGDLLDLPCEILSAGNPNLYVAVRDAERVDKAWIDIASQRKLLSDRGEPTCVFVFAPTRDGAYSRMFSPEHGVVEDPATGSATGPLAAFMMRHGLCAHAGGTRLVSEQGVAMGRRSLLHVFVHGESGEAGIEIGGHVAPFATARTAPAALATACGL